MGKITSIKVCEKDKNRCNVFVDGEFSFAIPIEIAYNNNLKVGLELNEQKINELIFLSDKSKALSKGINYVSKNLKTKKQVKDYLLKKGFSIEITYFVIDKLKEYKYIDDVEYSKRYIESCYKKEGKKLLFYKLMAKGVKKEDIENAYLQVNIDNSDNLVALVEKHMRNKEKTIENISKTYRYLLGKGFSYEEVDKAISIFKEM